MIAGRILPSLTSLECFEAAARHLSFTKAAHELSVTQSAVSRQIRQLEEQLGRTLFHRHKQRLILTQAGSAYAQSVRDILQRAESATLRMMVCGNGSDALTVATLPTFGTRWLIPRLGDFVGLHPHIHLNLLTQVSPFDFEGSDIDLAIHFGSDVWPGAVCHRLMGESVVPVAAPSLLASHHPVRSPADVTRFPLLQHTTRPHAWHEWLIAAEVPGSDGRKGPRFEQIQMVIEAAIAGLGLAILPVFLIQEEIASAQLVVAIDFPITSQYAYYLVYPETKSELDRVVAFRDWLLGQCHNPRCQ